MSRRNPRHPIPARRLTSWGRNVLTNRVEIKWLDRGNHTHVKILPEGITVQDLIRIDYSLSKILTMSGKRILLIIMMEKLDPNPQYNDSGIWLENSGRLYGWK